RYAVTLVPLFFAAHRLERASSSTPTLTSTTGSVRASEGAVVGSGFPASRKAWLVTVPVVTFAALAWTMEWTSADAKYRGTSSHNLEVLPAAEWLPLFRDSVAGWQPSIRRPDRQFSGAFLERGKLSDEADREEVFVGLYTYDWQRPGGEVVQYE